MYMIKCALHRYITLGDGDFSKSHRLANIRQGSLYQGFKMGEILFILNVSGKNVEKRWHHH